MKSHHKGPNSLPNSLLNQPSQSVLFILVNLPNLCIHRLRILSQTQFRNELSNELRRTTLKTQILLPAIKRILFLELLTLGPEKYQTAQPLQRIWKVQFIEPKGWSLSLTFPTCQLQLNSQKQCTKKVQAVSHPPSNLLTLTSRQYDCQTYSKSLQFITKLIKDHMNTNTEFQQLTNQLKNIIATLNKLEKTNQPLSRFKTTKIKKTSDMTYYEYLVKVLEGRGPYEESPKDGQFNLYQDIIILIELSTCDIITDQSFEVIIANNRMQRSLFSMRERYQNHLIKIGEVQMKQIVSWVEVNGLEGFMSFVNGELRIISSISQPNLSFSNCKSGNLPRKSIKNIINVPLENRQPTNSRVPVKCKMLNEVLKMYSKMVCIPIKTLLRLLHQVSGDMEELDRYIESRDERLLWTAEEDQILKKGGSQGQLLLRRYRGERNVEARLKYMQMNN